MMENLRPNSQRAKNAIILIWIIFGFEVLGLISGYFQYELLQAIDTGGAFTAEDVTLNDMRERVIAILNLIAFIISVVMFLQWFRRAYFNLHLKVSPLAFSEGWAAGSWFVPFINLFRPYQIMRELYEETRELLRKNGRLEGESLSTTWLGIWWALWIINNVIGQVVFRMSRSAKSAGDFIVSTEISMMSNIVGIALAIVAVKVIRDYAKVEPLLNEVNGDGDPVRVDAPGPSAPPVVSPAS